MRELATGWVKSPPVEAHKTECTPISLLPQLISLLVSLFFGTESTVSEAASPEVEPAEFRLGSEYPRELGNLG